MQQPKWDGRPRRESDFNENGKVEDAVIWARIDERVNTLITNAVTTSKEFKDHVKDDNDKFDEIHKAIWRAGGIITGACGVIVALCDWLFRK